MNYPHFRINYYFKSSIEKQSFFKFQTHNKIKIDESSLFVFFVALFDKKAK